MDATQVFDYVVKGLLAIGGLAGMAGLLSVRAQKRKLLSESGRTDAEADSVLADAQSKRTAREISMIEPYERIQARMQGELDDVYAEIDRLKDYIETLVEVIRKAGVPVPDMPPKKPRHSPATTPVD
jgi:hypothetical protein